MDPPQQEVMYDLVGFMVTKLTRSYMTCCWDGSISGAHINGNHWSQLTG